MNKLIAIILIFTLPKVYSQTTFDWENATDTGSTVEQTVNGITISFSLDDGNPRILDASGFGGTNGNIVAESSWQTGSIATFKFSSPINITSIYALEGSSLTPDAQVWTFTPSDGSNSSVSETIPGYGDGGTIVRLNWTNVLHFTVTSAGSPVYFGFDNIESDFVLSDNDQQKRELLKIHPNPTSDFISVTGLRQQKSFTIFNSIGISVLKNTIYNMGKINVSDLQAGVYLLKLNEGSIVRFIKI